MDISTIVLAPTSLNAQGTVINEIDVIAAEGEQFVELFGQPEADLEGYTIALVKAQFLGGGVYEAQVYEVIDLMGSALNDQGFADFAAQINTTIAAVALYETEAVNIIVGEEPPADDIIDAIVYGNTSPGNSWPSKSNCCVGSVAPLL